MTVNSIHKFTDTVTHQNVPLNKETNYKELNNINKFNSKLEVIQLNFYSV